MGGSTEVTRDVSRTNAMIKPGRHLGEQIKQLRIEKGFSVQDAMDRYNTLAPDNLRVAFISSYYEKEKNADLRFNEVVLMLNAIGITDIFIDDPRWN